MLTAVERVMILKNADLLREVGPRHLLELAEVAREVELNAGEAIYLEDDTADALYMIVEGRVRLSTGDQVLSEVGPGEAFGTWALVDDSARGQRAECIEDGMALALHRDAFYDVAADDLTLLKGVLRALAKRMREMVAERPQEARVEGEGVAKPEAAPAAGNGEGADKGAPVTPGESLTAAALGKDSPDVPSASVSVRVIPTPESERAVDGGGPGTVPGPNANPSEGTWNR